MRMRTRCWATMLLAAGIVANAAAGQDKTAAITHPTPAGYDVNRETTLIGTVQSYSANAQMGPLGAHVVLQTSSGAVDVHLGDARLLTANKFTLQNGDSLRVVGEIVSIGNRTQYVARIIQKGTQALALRSVRGYPLSYMAPREAATAKTQGGAL